MDYCRRWEIFGEIQRGRILCTGLMREMAIKSLVKYKEAEFCVGVNAGDGKSLLKYKEAEFCVGVNAGGINVQVTNCNTDVNSFTCSVKFSLNLHC